MRELCEGRNKRGGKLMEYITVLNCIVSLFIIAIMIYLTIDTFKEVRKFKRLNNELEETLAEFKFKNKLRGEEK